MTTAHAAMHPKIKNRYAQVKREKGQRRMRLLSTSLVLLALLALTALVLISPILNVDRIHVRGTTGALASKIKRVSGVRNGEPLIVVRAKHVAKQVEAIPEVLHAAVAVHWPHEVDIVVTTRVGVVAVADSDKFVMIAADGVALNPVTSIPTTVIKVTGASAVPKPGRHDDLDLLGAAVFVNGLRPETRARIASLTISDGHELIATIRIGTPKNQGLVAIRMGSLAGTTASDVEGDMDGKAVAADTMIANAKLHDGETIDVHIPKSPILTDPSVTTTVPALP